MHSIQTQRHTLNKPLWVARNYQCLLIPWSNPLKSRVRFVKEGLVTEPIAFMRCSCVERKLLNIHLRSKSHEVIGRSSCGVRIYVHVPIKKIYIYSYIKALFGGRSLMEKPWESWIIGTLVEKFPLIFFLPEKRTFSSSKLMSSYHIW